jgi:hypothetical protein
MAGFMVTLKRRKSGGYAARKVIPKDVRKEYAALYGMNWEEKLNIPAGTSPHEARVRHCEWLAEIETRIAAVRAAKTGEGQPLTRRNAHALAGEWYRWFICRHEGDERTPSYWKRQGDTLVWDVIHPHAPDEYLGDTRSDPEWEWKAHPDVRKAVRPLVAQEAQLASFLVAKGMALNEEAMNLFVDAVEDNLLPAFVRLETLARGDYGSDPMLEQFPAYVTGEHTRRNITCWILFEAWQAEVQPSRSTVARWTTVFKAADGRFPDATTITPEAAKEWMTGLIDENRTAQTIATVWKTALKTVFTWAVGERLARSNPFKEVRISVPRRTIERETKAFTAEEAEIILSAALAYTAPKTVDERARRVCAATNGSTARRVLWN